MREHENNFDCARSGAAGSASAGPVSCLSSVIRHSSLDIRYCPSGATVGLPSRAVQGVSSLHSYVPSWFIQSSKAISNHEDRIGTKKSAEDTSTPLQGVPPSRPANGHSSLDIRNGPSGATGSASAGHTLSWCPLIRHSSLDIRHSPFVPSWFKKASKCQVNHKDTKSTKTNERRGGFTLVELLVAIAIIAILASVALGTMFMAQQAAREERTTSLVTKLHQQMMLRWESYRTRRLPLETPAASVGDAWQVDNVVARRELMRMELPDKYADLLFPPGKYVYVAPGGVTTPIRPAAWVAYRSRLEQAIGMRISDPPTQAQVDAIVPLSDFESAECLYMIMTTGMEADNTGRALFGENDVADTDNDGLPEFIDGWGKPIEWIRWPAGYVSDLQPAITLSNGMQTRLPPSLDLSAPTPGSNHDPFDPYRVDDLWLTTGVGLSRTGRAPITSRLESPVSDQRILIADERGYRLFPLIFSAGRDGIYGLFHFKKDPGKHHDPYAFYESEDDDFYYQNGESRPSEFGGHLDNIASHSLETR